MSQLTYDEIAYDEALRPCGLFHTCARCKCDYEHEIDTPECDLVEGAIMCLNCRADTEDCMPRCPNLRDENAEHSAICERANKLAGNL